MILTQSREYAKDAKKIRKNGFALKARFSTGF